MSKNVYFNGELIPTTSNFKRLGSSYSKSKDEARAKFIQSVDLNVYVTPDWKEIVKDNPLLVEVDEEKPSSSKQSFSKYHIRLKAPESLQQIDYKDKDLVTGAVLMEKNAEKESNLNRENDNTKYYAQKQKYYEDAALGLNQPRGDEDDFEYEDKNEESVKVSPFEKSQKSFQEIDEHLVDLNDAFDKMKSGQEIPSSFLEETPRSYEPNVILEETPMPSYREESPGPSDENNDKNYEDDLSEGLGGGKRRTRRNKKHKKRMTKRKRRSTKKKHQKKRKGTRKR